MYFVDQDKIEKILAYLTILLKEYKEIPHESNDLIEKLALERISHLAIDSILDVGNAMIDGFIMRDPGSYEDILDILEDEKVLDEQSAKGLKEIVRLRKMLVQEYTEIDHSKLYQTIATNMEYLEGFSGAIHYYLEHELGPVSAFKANH